MVHYQPIVDLDSKAIVGFEALVRWLHPTRGLLRPTAFIEFAEQAGFIGCRGLLRADGGLWPGPPVAGGGTGGARRLGQHQPVRPGHGGDRHRPRSRVLLSESGFDPSNLIVEITESAMMSDIDAAVHELRSLKDLGLRIAIDDFGTGYSSSPTSNGSPSTS